MDNKIIIKIDERLKDLIPNYLENKKIEIQKALLYFQIEDFNSLEDFGHRLKGNAGSYGFDYLGELGSLIENESKKKDAKNIHETLLKMQKFINNLEIAYVTQDK